MTISTIEEAREALETALADAGEDADAGYADLVVVVGERCVPAVRRELFRQEGVERS